MFNLAADAAIYNDLVSSYEATGNSLSVLANNLAQSGVYQNLTSGLDDAGKASFLLANLGMTVGTTAGDAALSYFNDRLAAGVALEQIAVEAVTYLNDDARRNPAFDSVKAALDNKATVAQSFVDSGIVAATSADLNVIANVTDDQATVDAAQTAINDGAANAGLQTYAIAGASSSVTEGNSIDFTVTLGLAVSTDTVVNYQIQGVQVAGGTATPVADFGVLNGTLTIPAGETTGTITLTPTADQVTEGYEGFKVVLLDANFAEIATSGNVVIQDPANAGQTFVLTTGVDTAPDFTGGVGDDIFIAEDVDVSGAQTQTFGALDRLDGGAGNDVFNLYDQTNAITATGRNVSNIETVNVEGAAAVTVDSTRWTGLETLNINQSVGALTVTASSTQDVNTADTENAIDIAGGQNVVVTDDTADQDINVGESGAGTTNATGTITVTDTDQGTGEITVDGGTDVTVVATDGAKTAGTEADITVGANEVATGAVSVTQNIDSDASAAITAGDVDVTGGSTIAITANLDNTATEGNANNITAGTYTAVAGNTTTEVTVTQNVSATDLAATTTAGTAETAVVTFGALKTGESVAISAGAHTLSGTDSVDLCFTASKALTAEEVAAAFANLTNADTQANGGIVENGFFTGALDAGWTSGAASGATVTFTATTVGDKTSEITVNTDATGDWSSADNADAASASVFVVSAKTNGTSASTTVAAQDADYGNVVINDNATKSITTITLDGFDGAQLGGGTATTSLDSLTDLSVKDGITGVALRTSQTTLNLTVDGMAAASGISLDVGGATVETLNLTATGSASDIDFTAAAATDVNITADANLDVSGGTFTAATDIDITGAGNVTLGDVATAATDITASTATGNISATVDNSTNVATGSGNDTITIKTGATNDIDGTVELGDGDDTLVLDADDTTLPTGTVDAGDGTDTISMTTTSAAAYDDNTNFATAITGFERLKISNATAATIEADNLGFDYVIYGGAATGTLNDVAANSTTVLEAASNALAITLDDATGTSDVANVVLNNKAVNSAAAAAPAIYTVDFAGASATAADTFSVGGQLVYTATGADNDVTIAAGAIATGNITVGGVVYAASAGSTNTEVVYTAQTNVDTTASGFAITFADGGDSIGSNATANIAVAPTQNGEDGDTTADVNFGTVTIDGVETINLTSSDATTSVVAAVDANTLAVSANEATLLDIDGAADLALSTTAPNLETVDASDMTGAFSYTAGVNDLVVIGSAGVNSITLNADNLEVTGGDSADTFIIQAGADLAEIDGGAGADTFDVNGVSTNKSNYAVITTTSGDVIDLAGLGIDTFVAAEITLAQGATESTQAYLDQAMTTLAVNKAGWFQYNGNTFITADVGGESVNSFADGTDFVIMITGLVDLGTGASFNADDATIEIA
jgi:S-layer protein